MPSAAGSFVLSGRNDHQFRSAFERSLTITFSGQCAPSAIHWRITAICCAERTGPSFGIKGFFAGIGRDYFEQITRFRVAGNNISAFRQIRQRS